jgi:hypothetical protein
MAGLWLVVTGCGRLSFEPISERVSITSPGESAWINAATAGAFRVMGECSGPGELVQVTTGSTAATAACTDGRWNVALDLGEVPDGDVIVTASKGTDHEQRAFRKDVVPPSSPGPVLDGSYNASLADSPSVAWQPAMDAGSGLDHYDLAIGLSQLPTSILDWTDVGAATTANRTALSLQEGRSYIVSVRAVDQAGNTTTAISDGFIPDLLSQGLVGHWTFNAEDVSGTTVRDVSGHGNDGTLLNGPSLVSSPLGAAVQFDGVDDYVEIPDSVSLRVTSMTVVSWVRFPAAPSAGWRMIFEHARNTTNWIAMVKSINGDWWHWRWQNGGSGSSNDVGTSRPFTVGTWVHLAFSIDLTVVPNKVQAYIDGVLDTELIGVADLPAAAAGVSTIGRSAINGGGEYLPGLIDEVRVYDHALTSAEVNRLYNLGR